MAEPKIYTDEIKDDEPLEQSSALGPTDTSGSPTLDSQRVLDSYLRESYLTSVFVDFTYGETIVVNNALYFYTADKRVYKAKAENNEKAWNFIGFAKESGTTGEIKSVQISGRVSGFTGLTVPRKIYLSDTAGEIAYSAGAYSKLIGFSFSTTEIFLYPNTEFYIKFLAGDVLSKSADTERNYTSSAFGYIKIKEFKLNEGNGTIRVKFDLRSNEAGWTKYGRIYKNGVAYGTERTTTLITYTTFSEDLNFVVGDLIQLYVSVTAGVGSNTVYTRNFRLYNDADRNELFTVNID